MKKILRIVTMLVLFGFLEWVYSLPGVLFPDSIEWWAKWLIFPVGLIIIISLSLYFHWLFDKGDR